MEGLSVGAAAARTGWSSRMLRYLEAHGPVVPNEPPAGYRVYGRAELNRLRALRDLRRRVSRRSQRAGVRARAAA